MTYTDPVLNFGGSFCLGWSWVRFLESELREVFVVPTHGDKFVEFSSPGQPNWIGGMSRRNEVCPAHNTLKRCKIVLLRETLPSSQRDAFDQPQFRFERMVCQCLG